MGGTSAGPQLLPVTGYLDAAAQRLLSFGGDDLSRVQVLVSSLPLAAELRTALAQAAGRPTLLPRFDTLRRWASAAPLAAPNPEIFVPLPESERLLLLHGALAERQWFDERALWGIAAELAALADELSSAAVLLPDDLAALRGQLEKPTPSKGRHRLPSRPASCMRCGMCSPVSVVPMRLLPIGCGCRPSPAARIAPVRPSRRLAGRRLSDAERAFLERYAERQSVEVVAPCPRESGTRRWRKCWRLRGLPCPTLSLQRPQVQVRLRKPPCGRRCATGRRNSAPGSSSAPRRKAFTALP